MAYTIGFGRNKGQALQQAETINTAPTTLQGGYRERFDIGVSALSPQFQQIKGQASQALGTRGLGRTSMYTGAMSDIAGKEFMATQDLYGSMMGQAQQESMQRDFQGMATSKFNAQMAEQARQFDENMRWKDYQASEASNNAKKAASAQAKSDTWKMIGKGATAFATGGASLLVPGGGLGD
jgi:hypothetical protein